MRLRGLAPLLLVLVTGCITLPGDDDDHDHDKDRPKSEERAGKYCVQEAKSRGMRVESVGKIEKVAKKQYEVKLRIDAKKKDEKKKDDFRVLCRYDDKSRRATLD